MRAGAGLRRSGGVEAVGEDAADRARLPGAVRARRARFGSDAPDGLCAASSSAARGGGAGRRSRVAADQATGSTAWAARWRRGRRALRPLPAGARRQQRDDRGPLATSTSPCAPSCSRAVGTAGQRCTTLRRLIVHEAVRDPLVAAPEARPTHSLPDRRPARAGTLVGPLIDDAPSSACRRAGPRRRRGRPHARRRTRCWPTLPDAYYVRPAIVEMPARRRSCARETFAPILYVMTYRDLDEAIALHNACRRACRPASSPTTCARPSVPLGGRQRLRHRQRQHRPLGAEIGGAFGGEKDTGGGRESGSDAWKRLHAPGHQHDQLTAVDHDN
jgi:aldehyde dehydrogenase (NAD+)